ncbi:hypothetical protein SCARR_05093 [Pontiella sulfatireligans]|uniref:Uncharacterized protein n=2 Tax=Pontiella sulfatireligans TaxID=2750658 RepID=A0A6C2UUZ9_9BACT|nr:hypothetical protein SCARR_05093 [Pontiella sulfatireligans]
MYLAIAAIVGMLSLTGCVSEIIEPANIPRVSTAQNSDGVVTLSWMSEAGCDYTVFVRDEETYSWKRVESLPVFHGTGELITIQDKRNPKKPLPWYSVRPGKH